MYIVSRDAMPSLVDSSIFMQAILCLPSLRKGYDKKPQNKINSLTFYQMSPLIDSYFHAKYLVSFTEKRIS